jgi:hypothetical protein
VVIHTFISLLMGFFPNSGKISQRYERPFRQPFISRLKALNMHLSPLDNRPLNELEFGMDDRIKTPPARSGEDEEVGSSRSEHCIPNPSEEFKAGYRHVDITAMIRSLQRTEGSTDCFRRGNADCDQLKCAWRQYCLETKEEINSEE